MSEKQALTEFLKVFKELPCLWDQNHSLYTSKGARRQAYNVLLESFKCYQKDANIEVMKKKLENMRTTYKREHKKVVAARAKGYDHRPTLWYYDLLTFIHNEDDDDNPLDFTENEDIEGSQCEYIYEEYEEEESKPKRLKISEVFVPSQNNDDITSKNKIDDNIVQTSNRPSNEALAFGRTVGLQLKELDNFQRIIAEKLISDTIFYARINKLTTKTTIDLN